MKLRKMTVIGLLAAIGSLVGASQAAASPNVNITLPTYCYYYDMERVFTSEEKLWYQVTSFPNLFSGRDYYGCQVGAEKYPAYKGWVGRVNLYYDHCNNNFHLPNTPDRYPNADGPIYCTMMMPSPTYVYQYSSTGFIRKEARATKLGTHSDFTTGVYVAPYGSYSTWRWVHKTGTWYAVPTQHVELAWLKAL